jgi:hypothetical protein
VFSAAFSPDGKRIVTTAQALVSQAKADVPRCLTPAQREAFLPPEPPGWCVDMEKWPYKPQNGNNGSSTSAPASPPLPSD